MCKLRSQALILFEGSCLSQERARATSILQSISDNTIHWIKGHVERSHTPRSRWLQDQLGNYLADLYARARPRLAQATTFPGHLSISPTLPYHIIARAAIRDTDWSPNYSAGSPTSLTTSLGGIRWPLHQARPPHPQGPPSSVPRPAPAHVLRLPRPSQHRVASLKAPHHKHGPRRSSPLSSRFLPGLGLP